MHDEIGCDVSLSEFFAEVLPGQFLAGYRIFQDQIVGLDAVRQQFVEQPPALQDAGGIGADLQAGAPPH